MSTKQASHARQTPSRDGRLRRLLPFLAAFAVLAVAGNAFWWLRRPSLEPLPTVATEGMTEPIRDLIQEATAQVNLQNNSAATWGDLGAVLFVHDMHGEAAVCLRNAERLDPSDYRWPYLLGLSLRFSDPEQTLDCYRRAARQCGKKAHVQLRLAERLLDDGELEEAAAQIDAVLAYAPTDPHGEFAKARLLFAQGDLTQAKDWARRSADAVSNLRAPHLLVAQLCRRTQDVAGEENALKTLEQIPDQATEWEDPETAAISRLRQDRMARLANAEQLAKAGQTAALKELLSEMAAGKDGSSAAEQLAWIYDRESNDREAESMLRRQLRGSPNDERLHFRLGIACFQQAKYADAEASFRRALELKPDYVDAWFNLSLTLAKLGKRDQARDAVATTVKLSPSRVQARLGLAELLLAEGKADQALVHLEAAARLMPTDQRIQELLARAKANRK